MNGSTVVSFVRDVVAVSRQRQVSVKSAGLAYHAFNTLVPLIILLFVGITLLESLDVLLDALEEATGLSTAGTERTLDEMGADGDGRLRAALLALVIFLWSAVRTFNAINSAFTDVYGKRKKQSYPRVVLDVLLTTLTITLAVALASVVGVALSTFVEGTWWAVVSPLLLFGLLVVAFAPMYYLFPEPDVSVREVLPGTAFAAVAWTILAVSFRFYVVTADSVDLYGVAGAVVILLTWVYLGGLCLLVGTIVNAVLADRVEAEEGWIPMREVWSQYARTESESQS